MEMLQLTTWIAAPEERCFRLATDTGFHQVLLRGPRANRLPEHSGEGVRQGDHWLWSGHCAGFGYRYATRIEVLRPSNFFREVLEEGYFRKFEHDHHFTFHNNGTRMRDEIRFSVQPGFGRALITSLIRRSLINALAHRGHLIKTAAESNDWRRFQAQDEEMNSAPNPGAFTHQDVSSLR